MPSRNTTTIKKKPVAKTPVAKEKVNKEKPVITVTKNSSPEEIIHSSWAFLNAVQFFNKFRAYFHLQPVTIEKLERALLSDEWNTTTSSDQSERESSVASNISSQADRSFGNYLVDFLINIIRPLIVKKRSGLDANTLDKYLSSLLPDYGDTSFKNKTILEKIKILKDIQDLYMEDADEKFIAAKNEILPETLRVLPLGTDYQGWTYWYFGDTRLYREIPIPNGKRGTDMINSTDFTFQLICSTVEEWHQIIKKFQPSNRTSSKDLASAICDIGTQVIGKLEARAAAIARNEAKLKRAKELELIPKKRSRRLEVKYDEEAKRQKVLEMEQQQAELEEIERKERIKREKKQAEEEKQELRLEEARLRNNVHDYITELVSKASAEDVLNLKALRNQLHKKATEFEHLLKMQRWIKLLDLDVTVNKEGDLVSFIGDDQVEALNHVLFKNTLSVYLMTLIKFSTDPETPIYNKLESARKNLISKRCEDLNEFCSELNNALKDSDIQPHAIQLLRSVFSPEPIETEELKEEEDIADKSIEMKQEQEESDDTNMNGEALDSQIIQNQDHASTTTTNTNTTILDPSHVHTH